MAAVNRPSGPRRAALAFILVTVTLDMLALGVIIPVLPKLVESFLGGDTAKAARVYGAFGTVWALMQFLCSPLQGALSDRFGRRPVVLLSNVGLGVDYVVPARFFAAGRRVDPRLRGHPWRATGGDRSSAAVPALGMITVRPDACPDRNQAGEAKIGSRRRRTACRPGAQEDRRPGCRS